MPPAARGENFWKSFPLWTPLSKLFVAASRGGAWAKHFRGETKDAVLRGLQTATLDIGDGGPVDVGPILKDVVEAGQFNRGAALKRLAGAGVGADQAETFLAHLDGLAAAQGVDMDTWVKRHIADIEVGGEDGPGIRFAKKVLYDDTGKVKLEYEDTGTEFNIKDRESLRAYFDSLKPEKIMRLKFDDPNKYMDVLKDIAGNLFPEGVAIKRMTKNGEIDFEHFLPERPRQEYIHTFPTTLSNQDIKLTLSKSDGEKVYLLKKFFNEEIQKDVWDMVILFNGGVHTKIPNVGKKGKRRWASTIEQGFNTADAEVSQSATLDGDTGNTPTRQEYVQTIDNNRAEGNPDAAAARKAVERLQSRAANALPLEVVDTYADLPEHIKARYRERQMTGGVRGVSDGKTVYLVADALESEAQAVALWMHEQGVHHGLRGLVGDDALMAC